MIRDFSTEKKEELYRALDVIDIQEWKPFMEWCGGRAGEFGVWADKLGISSCTRRIDEYQDKVLRINNSTRDQIDTIFECVEEVDRRYAETYRGHAETVKEQMAQVQMLTDIMRSVNRREKDGGIAIILEDFISALSADISIEKFEQKLQNYIQGNNVTYTDLCEYLDLLVEEHYLTQSEYVAMKGYISNLGHVPSSVEDIIKNNIFELLSNKKAYIAVINKKIEEAKQGMSSDNPRAIVEYRLLNIYRDELLDGVISLNELEEVINILEDKDPQIFTNIGITYIYDTSVCDDLVQKTIDPYIFAREHVSVELLNELNWAYVNEEHVKELRLVMIKYDITTVERLRHFLAQCHVESGITEDLLEFGHGAGKDYYPYYGAGRIQLTHDYGYYAFAIYKALECYPDLKEDVTYCNPAHHGPEEIFAQYDNLLEAANNRNLDISEFTNIVDIGPKYVAENYAWESAAYFWAIGGCNEIVDSFTDTDKSNVDAITSVVNKYDSHYKERREAYETIKEYVQ